MPSGKVHTGANVALATLFVASDIGKWAALGAILGIFLSPDLDVDAGFIGFRFLRKIPVIGPALSAFWRAFWYPYARLVGHRSWVSHAPVVSTVIRLAYLGVLVIPIFWWLGIGVSPNTWMVLVGLVAADITHALMDFAK